MYFVCGLTIPAEDEQRVERKYELLCATVRAIVGSFYRVVQMRVLFEQLSEVLKRTVGKLKGKHLMLAVKTLKNVYKVYLPVMDHGMVLRWLRSVPSTAHCQPFEETIWKDLLKLLLQTITRGDLNVDALYQVFSHLRGVTASKVNLPTHILQLHIELYRAVYLKLR